MEYVGVEVMYDFLKPKRKNDMEKFFISIGLTMTICQYYGFYLFAGWRGVVTALINMILYGLIAYNFKVSADRNEELAAEYRAKLHNAINERNNLDNELYNVKQQLYIHGLGKNPVNQ
jgi:hypothetical protein